MMEALVCGIDGATSGAGVGSAVDVVINKPAGTGCGRFSLAGRVT